jgi:hypothetical protein
MNTNNTSNTKPETTTETLGNRWKSADSLARLYGRSRPWIYAIADRFNIRNVSLGAPGKTGARLFDAVQLEELLEALAITQKDQPRINPREKAQVGS